MQTHIQYQPVIKLQSESRYFKQKYKQKKQNEIDFFEKLLQTSNTNLTEYTYSQECLNIIQIPQIEVNQNHIKEFSMEILNDETSYKQQNKHDKNFKKSKKLIIQNKQLNLKQIGCKCNKSQCLKQYCECFSNGIACGSECQCKNCGNQQIIKQIKKKLKKKITFCKCRRSGCAKNYCECYIKGNECNFRCQCSGCHNAQINKMIIRGELSGNLLQNQVLVTQINKIVHHHQY